MAKEPEVDDLVNRARVVTRKINDASDRLNSTLQRAQAALVELGLGVWARVRLWGNDEGDYGDVVFGKHDGRWGILIEEGNEHAPPEMETYTPVLEASREDRQRAAARLPELFEELLVAAEARLTRIERDAEIAEKVAVAASKARS